MLAKVTTEQPINCRREMRTYASGLTFFRQCLNPNSQNKDRYLKLNALHECNTKCGMLLPIGRYKISYTLLCLLFVCLFNVSILSCHQCIDKQKQ